MTDTLKKYLTTAACGFFIAGQRIPHRAGEGGMAEPVVGHELMLTEAQAKYHLTNLEIEPAPEAETAAPLAKGKPMRIEDSSKAL